jgi:phosphoserine aminotransferase
MVYNFNAGPTRLPDSVLQEASQSLLDWNGSGLSILEVGHRSPAFVDVVEESRLLVHELLQLDSSQHVLFLHGGASTQFFQVPMNLLDARETAAYADTGVWSSKAMLEAKAFGKVDVVCSSKNQGYRKIPTDFAVSNEARYFHITTNNTIHGTQWKKIPFTSNPMVADMSSDIFSRVLPFDRFALIYAGAQKNLGPAGVTLVVVREDILGKVKRNIPTMLDYRKHISERSILNTPPVFAIYTCLLNLRWLKSMGGIEQMESLNAQKAAVLYGELDQNPLFQPLVEEPDRSRMNVCFSLISPELNDSFRDFAKQKNIYGIEGHRLAGAFRASLYNAIPISHVEYLIGCMKEFTSIYG